MKKSDYEFSLKGMMVLIDERAGNIESRVRIMSFNIKRPFLNRLSKSVKRRSCGEAGVIVQADADIVCLQELMPEIKEYMLSHLSGYTAVGLGRNKNGTGEHVDILVNNKNAEIVSYSTFFINHRSLNPLKKQIFIFPRICTTADIYLKKYGKEIRIYNVHLDHISRTARKAELKILAEHIERDMKAKPLPAIVCGDFNSRPGCRNFKYLYNLDPPFCALDRYRLCMTNKKSALPQKALSLLSRDGYVATTLCGLSLDHVFYTPSLRPQRMIVLRKQISDGELSDHYPVISEFGI